MIPCDEDEPVLRVLFFLNRHDHVARRRSSRCVRGRRASSARRDMSFSTASGSTERASVPDHTDERSRSTMSAECRQTQGSRQTCVRAYMRSCVRACLRSACLRSCVRACVRTRVHASAIDERNVSGQPSARRISERRTRYVDRRSLAIWQSSGIVSTLDRLYSATEASNS